MRPILTAAALLALAAPAAFAQEPAAGAAASPARGACMEDAKTLCPGVQPGGGRYLQCFKEHASELSAGCKAALVQMRQSRGAGAGAAAIRQN